MAASEVHRLQAGLLRAVAHPLRIRILELLAGTERSVGELMALTGAEASQLSHHLGVLRAAGVLASRREGSNVYYRISDPRTLHLLATSREILATSLSESGEVLDELRPTQPVAEPR
ncbi:MAG TPA: metalloregulator ArsR/SmtB family transcription factor [Actinomycetota bacterium]|nr:metalloregulator ArsR/SmtB family transcription factor [Actinomycetota bacterium]